jgi:hypothetical protein
MSGVTLNLEKFRFARDSVEFAGFEITPTTVKPAIQDFPTPKNLTDVRSWFGLVNQVLYAFSMTPVMELFRARLIPSKTFLWMDDHFEQSKASIVGDIQEGVTIFDKSRPTCLATDWSKSVVGYKSTAPAHPTMSLAVKQDGRSPSSAHDSHMLQSQDTHL